MQEKQQLPGIRVIAYKSHCARHSDTILTHCARHSGPRASNIEQERTEERLPNSILRIACRAARPHLGYTPDHRKAKKKSRKFQNLFLDNAPAMHYNFKSESLRNFTITLLLGKLINE